MVKKENMIMCSLFRYDKAFQSLVLSLATVLLFSIDNITYARGYGSGSGVGEFYNDYMPREQARFFALHDNNGNGFLNPTEVIKMRMSTKTFKQADIDKNGRLSRTEFTKVWAQLPTNSEIPVEDR